MSAKTSAQDCSLMWQTKYLCFTNSIHKQVSGVRDIAWNHTFSSDRCHVKSPLGKNFSMLPAPLERQWACTRCRFNQGKILGCLGAGCTDMHLSRDPLGLLFQGTGACLPLRWSLETGCIPPHAGVCTCQNDQIGYSLIADLTVQINQAGWILDWRAHVLVRPWVPLTGWKNSRRNF